MAPCKCKEKTPENSQDPCNEPEESFRQAYLRVSAEKVKAAAERNELQKRLEFLGQSAKKAVTDLNALLQNRDDQLQRIYEFLEEDENAIFKERLLKKEIKIVPRMVVK